MDEQGGRKKAQVFRVQERKLQKLGIDLLHILKEVEKRETFQLQLPDKRAALQGGANVQWAASLEVVGKHH